MSVSPSKTSISYDAIVVGSGITGGWAAKELTERGLRTLVLEAGPPVDPVHDFAEHLPPWAMPYRGYRNRRAMSHDQPIQQQCFFACDEWASKFFVNDRENPYTTPPDAPFAWIRGRHVGGRSIMWGRQVYRWSDLDFDANARDGIAVDWPIRYADLAPWYDYVERFIGVSGHAEGLAQLPDGHFLPPMALSCAEIAVRDAMERRWGRARVLTIGRTATLTVPHGGRAPCHYCGPCHRGCSTFSYFSSLSATLPAATRTGRMTLQPNSVVERVLYDERTDRVTGVRVIDATTRHATEYRARVVFLCASTLESTRLLLNSKTPRFSDGLANSSGVLGKYLMDHVFGVGAEGTLPGMEHEQMTGRRPTGIYVPRFRNLAPRRHRAPGAPHFVRGYAFQGAASRRGWQRGLDMPGFGAAFKASLSRLGPWQMSFGGFGECLPQADNGVALHPTLTDKWGIPALTIRCVRGANEHALIHDMQQSAVELLDAAGATDIQPYNEQLPPGLCIHEMGTARMGRDPKTSVLNRWNQCHDVPNLFVTDGACMTSSACQNPSLTYMALTARACDYAVRQLHTHVL